MDFPKLSDTQAECAVLSAACSRKDWLLDVLQTAKAEDFTTGETAAVFSVIAKMYEAGEEISVHTVGLKQKALEDAGYIKGRGLSLSDILLYPIMPHEFTAYMSALKESTERRRIFRAAQTAENMIRAGESSDVAFEQLERAVMERTKTGMNRELLTPQDMQKAILEAIENRADAEKRKQKVLYTSFAKLNRLSGGLEKGDLIILSAESGAGKSAFAMNIAYGTACVNKRPTLYLNSEMNTEQMALRWASFLTKVSHGALRNGSADANQLAEAVNAVDIMGNSKLYTLNIPDMQIAAVLGEVQRMKARYNIELAIVDYIGRMDALNMKDAKEWQVMKSAAQRLKTMAQELQITVVMVAQLTSDGGRLAQSSYMMHEADLWINIGKVQEEKLTESWPWNYVLTFRKARNVENGQKVMLHFHGDTLTFTDKESKAKELAGEAPTLAGMRLIKGGVPL